ncbi:MAG: hypothetical protein IKS54_00435 [Erysipelotrichaceae bacterium]|nr:hypothetical protein [Erysipelotrichaceae bacterium]
MRPYIAVYKDENKEYSGGFEQLLRQDKTLYKVSSVREDAPVTCFESVFPEWAYDYVSDGGIAILSGANSHTFSFDVGFVCRAAIEWIDLSFCGQGMTRICSNISVFSGQGKGELTLHEFRSIKNNLRPGFYPVFIDKEYGKGHIIYSGVPMSEIQTYEGSTLRDTSQLIDFDERISSVDKQKVGAALRSVIMDTMNKAGYPYISLWYYPDGVDNIFGYSIDGDGLLTEGINDLIQVSKETDTKFLFYINKQLCEDDPDLKEKLKKISENNLIGCHGGVHNAKDSYEENIRDLEVYEEWMNSLEIDPIKSYASPRGMYCANLGKALKDKGYVHSRDFGYAIDDYPYFPMNEGKQESPLQIPCDGFNVCRWMLKNKDEGLEMPKAEEILNTYKKLIDDKMERGLPLLFFCHPQYFGLYAKQIYPKMVEYARSKGAVTCDYVSYGDFWIERDGSEYDADMKDGKLIVKFDQKPSSVRFCINGKICDPGELEFTIGL